MSPAWIRKRPVPAGKRNPKPRNSWQVLYRRGGRGYRIEYAGTFKTQTEARTRRDLIAGWLASGLNPREQLALLETVDVQVKTPLRWRDDWITSRHDLEDASLRLYRNGTDAILPLLTVTDLRQVTVAECERVAGELVAMKSQRGRPFAPRTIANYWQAFEQLLDYVGVKPNPARDKRVRLPKLRRTVASVPGADDVATMLAKIARKYVLAMVTIEQTAMRVESVETLTWGVVDVRGCRLRLDEKGGKIRWVPVPRWLMRQLEASCPLEDRHAERRLFPGITAQGLRGAMARACVLGKIAHWHPHDLRHRRASLWHLQNIPDAVLAERVGHERPSFTKDVYVHVMPVAEIPGERLEAIVAEARR